MRAERRRSARGPIQTEGLTGEHSGFIDEVFRPEVKYERAAGRSRSHVTAEPRDRRRYPAVPLFGSAALQRAVPVGRRAAPQRPHRAVLLPLQGPRSFALAQRLLKHRHGRCADPGAASSLPPPPRPQGRPGRRYPRGGGAVLLPGAASGVVVPPAAAVGQLSVRVVVVEGVPQPAAVLPLPPVVLARPRRLRTERALRGKKPRGRGSRPHRPPLTRQLASPAMPPSARVPLWAPIAAALTGATRPMARGGTKRPSRRCALRLMAAPSPRPRRSPAPLSPAAARFFTSPPEISRPAQHVGYLGTFTPGFKTRLRKEHSFVHY